MFCIKFNLKKIIGCNSLWFFLAKNENGAQPYEIIFSFITLYAGI